MHGEIPLGESNHEMRVEAGVLITGNGKKAGTRGWSRRQCWLVARIKTNFQSDKVSKFQSKPVHGFAMQPRNLETLKLSLCVPSRPDRQIPHLGEDARHLHPI